MTPPPKRDRAPEVAETVELRLETNLGNRIVVHEAQQGEPSDIPTVHPGVARDCGFDPGSRERRPLRLGPDIARVAEMTQPLAHDRLEHRSILFDLASKESRVGGKTMAVRVELNVHAVRDRLGDLLLIHEREAPRADQVRIGDSQASCELAGEGNALFLRPARFSVLNQGPKGAFTFLRSDDHLPPRAGQEPRQIDLLTRRSPEAVLYGETEHRAVSLHVIGGYVDGRRKAILAKKGDGNFGRAVKAVVDRDDNILRTKAAVVQQLKRAFQGQNSKTLGTQEFEALREELRAHEKLRPEMVALAQGERMVSQDRERSSRRPRGGRKHTRKLRRVGERVSEIHEAGSWGYYFRGCATGGEEI